MVSGSYLRPLSSAVITQSQTLMAQNTTPVALLPQVRSFQTTSVSRDIDSAAKFIGAGAATVGVAGSGNLEMIQLFERNKPKTKQKTHRGNFIFFGLIIILHLGQPYECLVTHNIRLGKV